MLERNGQVYCHMWTLDTVKTGHRHKGLLRSNWKKELKRDGEMGRIRMKTM
jgi:hypothetical protein